MMAAVIHPFPPLPPRRGEETRLRADSGKNDGHMRKEEELVASYAPPSSPRIEPMQSHLTFGAGRQVSSLQQSGPGDGTTSERDGLFATDVGMKQTKCIPVECNLNIPS